MTTLDNIGSSVLKNIMDLITRFLNYGKNSDANEQIINNITATIINPYALIPYTFYPNIGDDKDDNVMFFSSRFLQKLEPYVGEISIFDWNTFTVSIDEKFTENIEVNMELNGFTMDENSPINANEEIVTPHTKTKSKGDNNRITTRDYTDPRYVFEKLKTNRMFREIYIAIESSVKSLFKEFNCIY